MVLLLKNVLFTLMVPALVSVYVPLLIVASRSARWHSGSGIAIVMIVIGGAIYAWCVWDFARFGRGTPAPIDPPKQLVVRGLYRYTRNPIYIGVLTIILGWTVYYESSTLLIHAMCTAACLQLFIVIYEEPHLRRVFGREYERYCEQVGRWIPRSPKESARLS